MSKINQTGFAFASFSVTKTYGDAAFAQTAAGGQSTGTVSYAVTSGSDVVRVDSSTGAVTILKAGSATITATKAGDGNYNAATAMVSVTIGKAAATVNLLPTASGLTVVGKLSASTFTGGTSNVSGIFTWTNPDTVVTATGEYEVTFTPADTADYVPCTCLVKVEVGPTITSGSSDVTLDLSGVTLPAGVSSVSLGSSQLGTGGTAYTEVFKLVSSNASLGSLKNLVLYDLKLLDQNGNAIENFTEKIKVKVKIPAGMSGDLHIFWYDPGSDKLTDMSATQENGYLVFETTHFSYYAIAQLAAPAAQPGKASSITTSSGTTANASTGDSSVPFLPLALLSAGSAAGLVIVRKSARYKLKKNSHRA